MPEPITLDSPETLRARIAGHRWAEEVIAYGADHDDAAFRFGFWRKIAEALPPEYLPKPLVTLNPMNVQESRVFGNGPCPYRQHAGTRYDDVPRDYLDFITESARELSRYLASRHREAVDRAEEA